MFDWRKPEEFPSLASRIEEVVKEGSLTDKKPNEVWQAILLEDPRRREEEIRRLKSQVAKSWQDEDAAARVLKMARKDFETVNRTGSTQSGVFAEQERQAAITAKQAAREARSQAEACLGQLGAKD